MEGFAIVFLCASSGRIREEALTLLELIGKVFKTKGEPAILTSDTRLSRQLPDSLVNSLLSSLRLSDVLSEISGEVRDQLHSIAVVIV